MMHNEFYNDFDLECLDNPRDSDYRTPFQIDRDRIIHSSALRRLQAKTQVFVAGEYDFYRTRLTHSLEVAQIGRSLCKYLEFVTPELSPKCFIDPDLIEGICLSHDIGHPPFGHVGEKILNDLMYQYGGFEGNAQTLRLITKTIFSSGGIRRGINPTRAFIDGVLKYKRFFNSADKPKNHFLYEEQEPILKFVFAESFPLLSPVEDINDFRSIECEVMNWADDVAYSLYDLSDGITAGFLNIENLETWCQESNLNEAKCKWAEAIIESIRSKNINKFISKKIGEFIQGCHLENRDGVMSNLTNRYKFKLITKDEVVEESEFYKKIAVELIFKNPRIHQLQYKAQNMLTAIFNALSEAHIEQSALLNLIPISEGNLIKQYASDKATRARLVCDYIAGMTDGFAIRFYKRLFDPSFGSISDIV